MNSSSTLHCPCCHSAHIRSLNYGRSLGGSLGATGGFIKGALGAVKGAQAGVRSFAFAGPVGMTLGGLGGALLGGLLSSVTYGIAGATLGSVVDQLLLKNYLCTQCGERFGAQEALEPPLLLTNLCKLNELCEHDEAHGASDLTPNE